MVIPRFSDVGDRNFDMTIARILLVLASFFAMAATHQASKPPTRAEQGELFVPRPQVARASALGFHSVIGDYYWLRAVQIVGGAVRPEAEGRILGQLIDVVTTLDPHVSHPYRFAAVWLTGSREDVLQANRLLTRSIEPHPNDWRNRFYLGFNHFYYLGDDAKAAEAIEAASQLPKAPDYLGRLAARLKAGSAGLDVSEAWLRQLVEQTDDGYLRAGYLQAIDEINTERRAQVLDAAREIYKQRNGRDIEAIEDLVTGANPVLAALPDQVHDADWVLDEKTGRIESSFYGYRYEPQFMGTTTGPQFAGESNQRDPQGDGRRDQ